MTRAVLACVACAALVGACDAGRGAQPSTAPGSPPLGPLPVPPTPDQALRLLLRNLEVPLAVSETCNGVGTAAGDATIGDFLAGFLAEQRSASNSIDATCERRDDVAHVCTVMLVHADADDEWAWGVSFDVDARDGRLVRESVECRGAG